MVGYIAYLCLAYGLHLLQALRLSGQSEVRMIRLLGNNQFPSRHHVPKRRPVLLSEYRYHGILFLTFSIVKLERMLGLGIRRAVELMYRPYPSWNFKSVLGSLIGK